MKKINKILLGLSCAFLFTGNVNAKTIKAEDIEPSSYVIGLYHFDRTIDENIDDYQGKLTTRHIMLAAKSIEGNNLEDMIIYYKNPRGNWINGLTGEPIEVPENFNIEAYNGHVQIPEPKMQNIYYVDDNGDINVTCSIANKDDYLNAKLFSSNGFIVEWEQNNEEHSSNNFIPIDQSFNVKIGKHNDEIKMDSMTFGVISIEGEGGVGIDLDEIVMPNLDVNEDNSIDLYDILKIKDLSEKEELTDEEKNKCDLNNDKKCNSLDFEMIDKYINTNYGISRYGDIDLDGKIDPADSTVLRRYIEGITPYLNNQSKINADVNNDGKIELFDAKLIMLYLARYFNGQETLPNNIIDLNVGDINKDKNITSDDYDMLNQYLNSEVQFNDLEKALADINQDGTIDNTDLELLDEAINGTN